MAFPAGSRWLRANPPETSMMSPRLPTPSMSLRRRTFISALAHVEDDLVHHDLGQGAVAGAGDFEDLFDLIDDHRLAGGVVGQRRRGGVGRQRALFVASAPAARPTLARVAAPAATAAARSLRRSALGVG